jgi:hypothetical protein
MLRAMIYWEVAGEEGSKMKIRALDVILRRAVIHGLGLKHTDGEFFLAGKEGRPSGYELRLQAFWKFKLPQQRQ